ncbi:MAG: prepilin peptidase [Candidatus Nanopelagicaceae bacterium]
MLATISVPLVIIDLRYRRLPNLLTYAGVISGFIIAILQTIYENNFSYFKHSVIFSFCSATFFIILEILSRGGMGMGDVKLAAAIGALLFYEKWQTIVLAFFLAFSLGAIYGIYLIFNKKVGRKTSVPFGPFMILGTWLALFTNF